MTYKVISADPPWDFSDGLKKMKNPVKRSARSQYETLSREEVMNLDVASLADPSGCVLALWVPGTLLQDGLDVMNAWGFNHKQTYIWVKTKKEPFKALHDEENLENVLAFGMGRLFRQTHELALIGTSGKTVYPHLKNKSQRSVSFETNAGHSIKPEKLQDSLDIMFPDVLKLELFARRARTGWTCIGDGVTGKDIRESIQELTGNVPSTTIGDLVDE